MEFIPAIDLLDGSCVRLRQGSYSDVDRYELDPVETAKKFEAAGARRIHLVDLNAARGSDEDERKGNRAIIAAVTAAVGIGVEVGGGVRTEEDVAELLDAGVCQVVVGTTLARNPAKVAGWIRRFGPVVLAGIDARDGMVQVAGWEQSSGRSDIELAIEAAEIGCSGIIYTNIARDGMMQGPDIARTNAIAAAAGIPVTLSGGISSHEDILEVSRQAHPLLSAVISGRAIYENAINVEQVFSDLRTLKSETARIWNFEGYWKPRENSRKPAVILDQQAEVRSVLIQNPKASAKSIEQGVIWQLLPENGRVLPAEIGEHQIVSSKDHGSCLVFRADFSAPAEGEVSVSARKGSDPEASSKKGLPGRSDESDSAVESISGVDTQQVLGDLEQLIIKRKKTMPEGSYTSHLFSKGEMKIKKKAGEEAVELLLAETDSEIISESADFLYHWMVLLAERGIPLSAVIRELSKR
ncbi:phosphoribosyl-ATP diphosphatase [Spirochaeta dissipatitropha]